MQAPRFNCGFDYISAPFSCDDFNHIVYVGTAPASLLAGCRGNGGGP